jgi:hypothetical protein
MGKFKLESDIFTNYDGTITEASFQFNEFGGQMKFVFDEIDGHEQPVFEFYKLPPGWESNDGGETIERVAGDKKGIVKSSQWGKWLMAVDELEEDVLTEQCQFDAREWIGTRWTMEVTKAGVGKPYSFEQDGEKKEGVSKDKNYPTAFLGKESGRQASQNGTSPTNGKVDSLSVLTDIPNPVVQAKIQELAKSLPHGEWFKEAYALLTTNDIQPAQYPDLVAAMGGRDLYESLGGKG